MIGNFLIFKIGYNQIRIIFSENAKESLTSQRTDNSICIQLALVVFVVTFILPVSVVLFVLVLVVLVTLGLLLNLL